MSSQRSSTQPYGAALPAVLFVVLIFFLNFTTRIVLAPLMPVLETQLGFDHAAAGSLFLALGIGNGTGLLLNGFISREINHNRTVGLSAICTGIVSLCLSQAWSYWSLLCGMLLLGVSVGTYLPSGIATVTSLVRPEDWGKTIATHEGAPNTAFVAAPLLAEAVLLFSGWNSAMLLLGTAQILTGILFLRFGRGGAFPGVSPLSKMASDLLRRPVLWLLVFCFSTAVGISLGPYSMLPLFLVDEHGFTREAANQLLSISRIGAVVLPFVSGWFTDRWGAKPALFLYFTLCGASTMLIGIGTGTLLIAAVMLQPMFSVLFFTPAFTVVSHMFNPEERAVVVSFIGPINAFLGVGLIPWVLGLLGQAGLFSLGFILQGGICMLSLALLPKFPAHRH
ncbi:MFS transporter [Pseudodesulfovibrio senegalensis]|jgi:NNP family nitrate/nitrite transporter-like MFS transporter|uniref:MFS transporter n=1 Tax=Pseudodesulfovibrio senegalensis TaxID=1721087 RepID=A0A6N6MWC6_9BACT|nr:MFS transporter [Pseudodesulfovibrio senegalensis]KAB1437216.1 MFS transporter [Pseudodesulfovibrio senegalensis]